MQEEQTSLDVVKASQESNRKLENLIRISVETYHQMATLTLLLARESDLRTGGARIATLTKELEQKDIREFIIPSVISGSFLLVGKLILATSPIMEELNSLSKTLVSVLLDPTVVLLGSGLLFVLIALAIRWGLGRLGWVAGKTEKAKLVVKGLQKITDLYVPHSALNGRIQEARQLRVRTEAKMHRYLGLTWQEIEFVSGTDEMRYFVDDIAASDLQRSLDENEYAAAGGEYWLEMLRAGLRGEIPAFICLYVYSAWEAHGKDAAGITAEISRWRDEALKLCEAEEVVFGDDFSEKKKVYEEMSSCLNGIESFSIQGLDRLLSVWRKSYPGLGLRAGDHRKAFEALFK